MAHFINVQAHDLLWGMTLECLADTAPGWVKERIALGVPVVVRRAVGSRDSVAVGIRGAERNQRYAAWLPLKKISKVVSPAAVNDHLIGHPVLSEVLVKLSELLPEQNWGVTGSHAYQAITKEPVTRSNSDLDIVLRQSMPCQFTWAVQLLEQLKALPIKIDLQIDTGEGGFSLADWVNNRNRVLLKTAKGPRMVTNPWLEAML